MDTLKRIYHVVAAIALLNLFVAGGAILYFVGAGTLTKDELRAAASALRPAPPGVNVKTEGEAGNVSVATSTAIALPTPAERELARLNLERATRSAEDRLKYASRMMVDIERRREQLDEQKQQLADSRIAAESVATDEVFQKDLEVLEMLKPKVALDNLLAREVDEAARLMHALDVRAAKKIVETASKDPGKWEQVLRIQEQMREPVE
jgi:hypothetical protein